MPGSPESAATSIDRPESAPLHPAAGLLCAFLLALGLSLGSSLTALASLAVAMAVLALRAEGASVRSEAPVLTFAAIVFAAHLFLNGAAIGRAAPEAARITLRLLALLYGIRWAARAILPAVSRWFLSLPIPPRPALLSVLAESARLSSALVPLAVREAHDHARALDARGFGRPGGLRGRARVVAAWLLPYLGSVLRAGEAYADALAARGYRLGRPRRFRGAAHWGSAETLAVLASVAAAAWLVRGV